MTKLIFRTRGIMEASPRSWEIFCYQALHHMVNLVLHPIQIVPSNIHRQKKYVARKNLPIEAIEKLCGENHHIILNGMSGVGKSELAIQYLFHCLTKSKYRAYMWVRAESQESLLNEYALIAKTLGLIGNDESNFDIIINSLLQELNKEDDWLIVFDNLDEIDLLHDKLPWQ